VAEIKFVGSSGRSENEGWRWQQKRINIKRNHISGGVTKIKVGSGGRTLISGAAKIKVNTSAANNVIVVSSSSENEGWRRGKNVCLLHMRLSVSSFWCLLLTYCHVACCVLLAIQ